MGYDLVWSIYKINYEIWHYQFKGQVYPGVKKSLVLEPGTS